MNIKKLTIEELETLSYTDLTEAILKDENKPLSTAHIFKQICNLLSYSDNEYAEKIGDFYTSLTTDKRFTLLESAEWDLKEKHPVQIILDDEEELEEEVVDEEEEEIEENIDTIIEDEDLDDDDDIDDLVVVEEEELEEED